MGALNKVRGESPKALYLAGCDTMRPKHDKDDEAPKKRAAPNKCHPTIMAGVVTSLRKAGLGGIDVVGMPGWAAQRPEGKIAIPLNTEEGDGNWAPVDETRTQKEHESEAYATALPCYRGSAENMTTTGALIGQHTVELIEGKELQEQYEAAQGAGAEFCEVAVDKAEQRAKKERGAQVAPP